MTRTILLLALVVLLSAGAYIVYGICKHEPAAVAEAEAPGRWLSLDTWHWPGETVECVSYVCGVGDTLWGIAERYYPERDPQQVVWAIRKVSGLEHAEGPVLQPGQVIIIPDPELYGVGVK